MNKEVLIATLPIHLDEINHLHQLEPRIVVKKEYKELTQDVIDQVSVKLRNRYKAKITVYHPEDLLISLNYEEIFADDYYFITVHLYNEKDDYDTI